MPKTKTGEKITWKEFGNRWKKGMEGVTVLQQLKVQLKSTLIILVGVVAGLIIAIVNLDTLWWLGIILLGALFNTGIQYLGIWQKKKMLEGIEENMKGGIDNE